MPQLEFRVPVPTSINHPLSGSLSDVLDSERKLPTEFPPPDADRSVENSLVPELPLVFSRDGYNGTTNDVVDRFRGSFLDDIGDVFSDAVFLFL